MYATSPVRLEDSMIKARAQRASFTPNNRELEEFLLPIYGRSLEAFHPAELAVARIVFAQVALMAGAALAADSETFFGAEHLWRDMQDRISVQERTLARRILEQLACDDYYSESERRLIGALARSLSERAEGREQRPQRAHPLHSQPPFAKSPIQVSESVVKKLRAQRDSVAPTTRELIAFFQAEFGVTRNAFRADEVATARTVFGQVVLMIGAVLAADAETYLAAEQMWSDIRGEIGERERALDLRFLQLLARDPQYTDSERRLIESLAAMLPEGRADIRVN